MKRFPEEFELIEFFEGEPELTDPDVPWIYNSLTFELSRDSDVLTLEVQPASDTLLVRLRKGERTVTTLDLCSVVELIVIEGSKILRAISETGVLEIEASPAISLHWIAAGDAV